MMKSIEIYLLVVNGHHGSCTAAFLICFDVSYPEMVSNQVRAELNGGYGASSSSGSTIYANVARCKSAEITRKHEKK
jgi:hypothetical protein